VHLNGNIFFEKVTLIKVKPVFVNKTVVTTFCWKGSTDFIKENE
jgi:hypothetical protein